MGFKIAIDGPAGAGKSTIAKEVAKQLGFIYVDTGAMYRAIALYLLRNHVTGEETEKIGHVCSDAEVSISYEREEQQVLLNGENVTGLIRTEEVGKMASASAKNPKVRERLLSLQRELANTKDVIMDGRDIGTQVLPNADLKIYLTASAEERAKRRWNELTEKGIACEQKEIEADIIARDEQDMNREISPLKQAEDAILIDSSFLSITDVVDKILLLYKEKNNKNVTKL